MFGPTNSEIERGARNLLLHRALRQPIVIPYENGDELVHTDDSPFCSDGTCACHDDRELVTEYIIKPMDAGLLTWAEGRQLFFGRQV